MLRENDSTFHTSHFSIQKTLLIFWTHRHSDASSKTLAPFVVSYVKQLIDEKVSL